MFVEIIIFVVTFIFGYYLYVYKKNHWKYDKAGIKYVPGIPVFGNTLKSMTNRAHILEDIDAVYKAFPDEKYVIYVEGLNPVVMVRDPEIIKNITVKDFDHFVNRKDFFSESDTLLGGSLLTLKDDKWRDMRSTLSPAFTGSKMRHMLPFMIQISRNIVEYLKNELKNDDIFNIDDIIRRYTNDVIASTAFGLEVNSVKDKQNEFYKIGQTLFKFDLWQTIVFYCKSQFPELSKKLKLESLPQKTIRFFQNLVSSTVEFRRKNKVERPDMLHLLMETPKEWTQNEITGQVFVFFLAGFESSANGLVMAIHELALNPEVQEKLYQEIKTFEETHSGLTYENINELNYLNCVISETSRKWSAAIILDRTCTKPYELPPPREGGKPLTIKPGDVVYNIVNSIHMDPQYFPDPHVFDPERFSEENKNNIKPFTYLPFGVGPRNCIGSRFALLELKVLLYEFILNFKIHKCKKTMDPIELGLGFAIKARDETWVRLESRN